MNFVLGVAAGGGLGLLTAIAILRYRISQLQRRRLSALEDFRNILRA
jgi:hypothetical protein